VIGTQAVAAWLAHLLFWVLVALGTLSGELRPRWTAAFVAGWLAGLLGLPRLGPFSGLLVTPYVGVLDIILTLAVFKGDVRLS
jgi:hypothetical protein